MGGSSLHRRPLDPGYWYYHHRRYEFFHGYWGRHIGFYGGITYGFGYTGYGYRGGYWRSSQFAYNRAVNNINTTIIHNTYVYNYNPRRDTAKRVSYNGGPGGLDVRPRLPELAALREPHAAPMNTQLQLRQQARTNRNQFAAMNHRRPADLAFARPVPADRGITPRPEPLHDLPPIRPAPVRPQQQNRAEGHRPQPEGPDKSWNPPPERRFDPRESAGHPTPVYPEVNRPERPAGNTPPAERRYPAQVEGERPADTVPHNQVEPVRPMPHATQPLRPPPPRTEPPTAPQRTSPQPGAPAAAPQQPERRSAPQQPERRSPPTRQE